MTGTVRADARPRAATNRRADLRGARLSHDYPITPKEHGVDYLMDRGTCGSDLSARRRFCACGTKW